MRELSKLTPAERAAIAMRARIMAERPVRFFIEKLRRAK